MGYNSRIYPFVLDMKKLTLVQDTQAVYSSNDFNTSVILIQVTMDNEPLNLTGYTVYSVIQKSDGFLVINDCDIVDAINGGIKLLLTSQSIAQDGKCVFELVLNKENKKEKLVSPKLIFTVDKSLEDGSAIQSSNEFGVITNLILKVDEKIKEIDTKLPAIDNSIDEANTMLVETSKKLTEVNDKIVIVDEKIQIVDGKLNEVNVTIQEEIKKVDTKLKEVDTTVSSKISKVNSKLIEVDETVQLKVKQIDDKLATVQDGKSAYEIWLKNGNTGSEQDFIASLKGDKGEQGIQGERGLKGDKGDKGDQGAKGDTGAKGEQGLKGDTGDKGDIGKSSYQHWLDLGNNGSESDFIISLKGDKGDIGAKGEQGIQGERGLKGDKGDKGDQGAKGDTGAKGEQGLKGDTGEQGLTGAKGDKGDKGDAGTTDYNQLLNKPDLNIYANKSNDNIFTNTQTFEKNGEVQKMQPSTSNNACYYAFYKNKTNRSGYFGYESSNHSNFAIVNEASNADILLKTNGAGNVKVNGNVISTFSGNYNDLSNKPISLPANGGNSTTVNNYSIWVGTQVEYDVITNKEAQTLYFIKEV